MFRFLTFIIIVTIFSSCFSSMILDDGLYLIEQQNDKCGLTTQMSTKDSVWRTTLIPFEYDTIYGLDELGCFVIDDDGDSYFDFKIYNWCVGQKNKYLYFIYFYDSTSTKKTQSKYEDVKMVNLVRDFNNLIIAAKKDDYWGIIDQDENEIVSFIYDEVDYLNINFPYVKVRKGDFWGIATYCRNEIIPTEYDEITFINKKEYFIIRKNDTWGIISENKMWLPVEYQEIIKTIYDRYLIVKKDDKYGVWDVKNASMLIEPKFIYLTDIKLMNVENKPKKALFVYSTENDELFWVDKNGEIIGKVER